MVTPRLDAVEEITVTGATPGSGGGPGSVQIGFITRSGTNDSIQHLSLLQASEPELQLLFNKVNGLERDVMLQQYGGRIRRPDRDPRPFNGRNKAFFFLNFEHLHQPSEATRTRTFLNPDAQSGVFSYLARKAARQ